MLKRCFDILIASILLLILSPLLLVIAILVRWKLGSPVIFQQHRPGKNDKLFNLYKFRSMRTAVDAHGKPLADEERITPLGNFLRHFSLDELPQLVNVLKGDISLVGPRPLLMDYLPLYNARQRKRHEVRPGITGWAQVNGRNRLEWPERLELDVWYVENQSFSLDLKILWLTFLRVIKPQDINQVGQIGGSRFFGDEEPSLSIPLTLPRWPQYADDEIAAVSDVLRSGKVNYWTGDTCKQFEAAFAAATGTQYAIAMANGTVALEAALYAINLQAGDAVIIPSKSFFATASCVIQQGGVPLFADIDLNSQALTVESIAAVYTPQCKAIIVVHLAGYPADMTEILAFAKQHNLFVIEDCAQAHGAMYQNKAIGSFGDIAAFSFCQDKIISTGGEGGMVVTNNHQLWQRAWSLKDHGKSYEQVHQQHPPGFRWLHTQVGSNYRMTGMQAAIGLMQLKKLPDWIAKRQRNAALLTTCFAKYSFCRLQQVPNDRVHSYYKYYVFINTQQLKPGMSRDQIMLDLNALGVACTVGSCSEMYLEQAIQDRHLAPAHPLAHAQCLAKEALMFEVHPALTERHMQKICECIDQVFATIVE